jgi:EAL domain-containing protein (putative c-di-GMP-specific phosphodiesterase class I)
VEALVRWQHPERGLLPPDAFITLAEETGLIVPLDQWLLRQGCRQLKAWQDQFRRDPPLTLNVNLSGQQFMQPDLDQFIRGVLDEFGLAPNSLRLEITERTIIDDTQATAGVLASLRALGVQLEIDDFGTGYSALSYLQRLKLDAIKIDRSFVSRLGSEGSNSAVVRTILALGNNLGLRIIAEGVETEDQFAKLKALGCQNGQGFLFGKPTSDIELTELLETALDRDGA